MPITNEVVLRYSAPSAISGGTVAGTSGASLGKYCANNTITSAVLDNLFPDLTGDENASLNVDYQCVFVHNTHATLTLIAPVVWLSGSQSTATTKAVAVDNIVASAYTSATAQAAAIASKNTAPAGVGAFSSPAAKASGLALGDLGPGEVRAVWIQRTATNSAATNNDGVTLNVQGDTLQ